MLYEYTPESVGGKIVFLFENGSWHGHSKNMQLGDDLVNIRHRDNGELTVIVMRHGVVTKIISSVQLDWYERESPGYFYPRQVQPTR